MSATFEKRLWLLAGAGIAIAVLGDVAVVYWTLPWYWPVAIFFLFLIAVHFVGQRRLDERLEAHFSGRPVLDEAQFGRSYFPPDQAEIARQLRKILAKHVDVDLGRLHPSDRFIEDLLMDDFDSLATVDFVIAVEKEFGLKIPNDVAATLTTFQRLADYIARNPHRSPR